jgi:MFS family permease
MDNKSQNDVRTQTAALVVSMISAVVNSLMNASLNVALPSIGREFSLGAVSLGWVATAMLLSASIFIVPFGRLADIYGRKLMMMLGSAIYFIASFSGALSTSGPMLIAVRVAQGIGGAMTFGTGVALLTSIYPPEKKGWAIGWNVSAVYFGLATGPFIGGFMTAAWGWRSLFWLNGALGLLSVILLLLLLKGEWADAKGEKLDVAGSAILGGSIFSIIFGLMRVPSKESLLLIPAGVVLLYLFIKFEEKHEAPVVNVSLFENNPAYTFSNLSTLINYSAASSVAFLISLYLQYIKGFDPRTAGIILMAQPLVMVIFAPWAGRLSDRVEPARVASFGMALTAIGLLLFVFLEISTPVRYVISSLLIIGGGYALFSSPNTNAVMSAVDRKYYGTASSIVATMRQMGQMTGMAIGTMMISIFAGRSAITPESHAGLITAIKWAFIISTLLCALGVFASLVRTKKN